MPDIAIKVEGLGKRYRIGARQNGYRTLREKVNDVALKPFRNAQSAFSPNGHARSVESDRIIWALKDVSFEVKTGEVLGVIGRNGAGKSTLLKVLSRITEPTSGAVDLYGRVGSLLEVGTGFHPELTGRENIFLNGAILGMRRAEIARKFDEIVAFAEVDRFIDTPVKRYSSGMYVRLAFAVAAHLEPEILLVDEVLAVGDAQFQKKCLGKMGEVGREGRTVLFVSHNMTALTSLCRTAIWLNDGAIVGSGEAPAVVTKYLRSATNVSLERTWENPRSAPGNEKARLHRVSVSPVTSDLAQEITTTTPLDITFEYWNREPDASLNVSFVLYDVDGACVLNSISKSRQLPAGLVRSVCHIPGNFLNDTTYRVRVLLVKDTSVPLLDEPDVIVFEVHDVPRDGNWYGKWIGVTRPEFDWNTNWIGPSAL